jgi:hypothetical protein
VPSCFECNNNFYGKRENRIFPFLGLSAEPDHPGAKGIAKRALRAMDESRGKKPKDKEARARVRELFRSRMTIIKANEVPEGADHLGWRHENEELLGTWLDENGVLPVIGKIARGFIYIDSGFRLTRDHPEFTVKPFRELSKVPKEFLGLTASETAACGPGIVIDIVRFAGHYPPLSFMQITVWNTHVWYVAVVPRDTAAYFASTID